MTGLDQQVTVTQLQSQVRGHGSSSAAHLAHGQTFTPAMILASRQLLNREVLSCQPIPVPGLTYS